ncbi:dTDP-glucose 4,6-dehydratase [Streptomyces sp. MMBL 11-1]|uniref:dTDP-glucose 4,6-dehydratase n=1 Tax=Streptomyces sp. MMBL 11-1 TaxID=3026420 RepID=UPI002361847F|nr:NAD-dependent epimerase/dehydratase family protein [Streptomyces sp. MMBL 11-1]
MSKRILLTGAGGFVGSHILRHLLTHTDWDLVCPVTFRHHGNSDRIASAIEDRPEWHQRVQVVMCDLTAPISTTTASRLGPIDYILNVASESHVDRSITDPVPFIRNNVDLILNLLEYARITQPAVFLQMSTDEVYGPAPADYAHREWDTIAPSNPYSASKAAQEAIAFSYWRTYGVPVVITNTMNIIGEMQSSEKFLPKTMRAVAAREPATVHVSPEGQPGSRFYLHARNLADAWLWLLNHHTPQMYPDHPLPSRFHIVGEREINNVEMVHLVADTMGVPNPELHLVDFHASRPGHDLRYALDGRKLAAAGWKAPVPLEESLTRTIGWTLTNPEWLVA